MKKQNTLSGAKLGLVAAFVGTLVIATASALPPENTPLEGANSHIASTHQPGTPVYAEDIIRP